MTTWSETDTLMSNREERAIYRATQERIDTARAKAAHAVREGRTDWATADAWVATIVGAALVDRDAALAELEGDDSEVPADAPCRHASCLWAVGTECHCYGCLGVGHGHLAKLAAAKARTEAAARMERRYGGSDVPAYFAALGRDLGHDDQDW